MPSKPSRNKPVYRNKSCSPNFPSLLPAIIQTDTARAPADQKRNELGASNQGLLSPATTKVLDHRCSWLVLPRTLPWDTTVSCLTPTVAFLALARSKASTVTQPACLARTVQRTFTK
jgi:hypothetical protein